MTIRPLAEPDLLPIADALARLPLLVRYRRDAGRIAADLEAARARGDGLLVACGSAGPQGLAWFTEGGTLGLGGYLRLLAVAGDGQRTGTGSALLRAFELAVARRSRHAFLLVSDFNQPAQRFYERAGYARVGALPGLVLADVEELLYWKRLAST